MPAEGPRSVPLPGVVRGAPGCWLTGEASALSIESDPMTQGFESKKLPGDCLYTFMVGNLLH